MSDSYRLFEMAPPGNNGVYSRRLVHEFMVIHCDGSGMGRTSIPCSDDTRDQLSAVKQDGETWDDCLSRLVDGAPADEGGNTNAELLEKFDSLEAKIEELDEPTTGDATENNSPSVNEIREAVRAEVRDQIQGLMH